MIKQFLLKGHIVICFILVSCTDTSVTPNFPKDLGLNRDYEYSIIDWFTEYEELQQKVQPDDTVGLLFEENLLGFNRARWFTLMSTNTYRYFKVTANDVIWKESVSGSEVTMAKRNMSVGDTWNDKLVWENSEVITCDYEVVDFMENFTLNSIEYHNVFVLEEWLYSNRYYSQKWFYWISHERGIIKAVSPSHYNGTYMPAVFEKLN